MQVFELSLFSLSKRIGVEIQFRRIRVGHRKLDGFANGLDIVDITGADYICGHQIQRLTQHVLSLRDHVDGAARKFDHAPVVQTECLEERQDQPKRVACFVTRSPHYLSQVVIIQAYGFEESGA